MSSAARRLHEPDAPVTVSYRPRRDQPPKTGGPRFSSTDLHEPDAPVTVSCRPLGWCHDPWIKSPLLCQLS